MSYKLKDSDYNHISSLATYDPINGKIYSKVSNSNVKTGEELRGTIDERGYIRVGLDGKTYTLHRLAFLLMKEVLPEQVDHINRDKSDNRWSNLRGCNQVQNQWNIGKRSTNTSGYKNVSWRKQRNTWIGRFKYNGETYHVGSFDCPHKANLEVLRKRKEIEKR